MHQTKYLGARDLRYNYLLSVTINFDMNCKVLQDMQMLGTANSVEIS